MTISKKDFFINNQVLFIGVSSNPKSFSRSVYKDFVKAGIEVYPVNPKGFSIGDNSVYKSVNQLPQTPECAYILLNKENTKKAVDELKGRGVKKILFHNKNTVDQETLSLCKSLGIEPVVACPKMMINPLPIHRIHGFLAGVR